MNLRYVTALYNNLTAHYNNISNPTWIASFFSSIGPWLAGCPCTTWPRGEESPQPCSSTIALFCSRRPRVPEVCFGKKEAWLEINIMLHNFITVIIIVIINIITIIIVINNIITVIIVIINIITIIIVIINIITVIIVIIYYVVVLIITSYYYCHYFAFCFFLFSQPNIKNPSVQINDLNINFLESQTWHGISAGLWRFKLTK